MPFWDRLRTARRLRTAMGGINAAAVGLLVAAFYDPVWTNGILSPGDFIHAIGAFALLTQWTCPPWEASWFHSSFNLITHRETDFLLCRPAKEKSLFSGLTAVLNECFNCFSLCYP